MTENAPVKILIVDDETAIRESLVCYLEDCGYEIASAQSGEDALEILKGNPQDIGIIDLRLPGMSGEAMILEAYKLDPKMRFIIHTGSVDYCLTDEMKQIGLTNDHLMLKPLSDLSFLENAINTLVQEIKAQG